MTTNKEWSCNCFAGKVFEIGNRENSVFLDKILNEFEYCPYCGKQRPEEPKALWECLRDKALDHFFNPNNFFRNINQDNIYKFISNTSLDWFKDILPDTQPMHKGHTEQDYKDDLIELLNKEKEKCK